MLEEGIPANTYFAIDGVILAIECNQKYFYVNFLELSSKEEVLKLHLGDKKVKDAISNMIDKGIYKKDLWS